MIVMVTGSREWTDHDKIRETLEVIDEKWGPSMLVHGDCRGADRIAAAIAIDLGWNVRAMPAEWIRFGKAAGPMRNRAMIDQYNPDLVLAFPTEKSVGTWDAVRYAASRHIPITVVPPNKNPRQQP